MYAGGSATLAGPGCSSCLGGCEGLAPMFCSSTSSFLLLSSAFFASYGGGASPSSFKPSSPRMLMLFAQAHRVVGRTHLCPWGRVPPLEPLIAASSKSCSSALLPLGSRCSICAFLLRLRSVWHVQASAPTITTMPRGMTTQTQGREPSPPSDCPPVADIVTRLRRRVLLLCGGQLVSS